MAIGLDRYGLQENPFDAPPLRCVDNAQDCGRFESIHEIDEPEIKKHMAKAGAAGPAFFLVTGPSGSGRTVVARHLIATYRDLRRVPAANFAYAEHDPGGNESPNQVLTDLLAELASQTEALNLAFKPPADIIYEGLKPTATSADFKIQYRGVVTRYSNAMTVLGGSFGCILERPARLDILQAAVKVFEQGKGILVFTLTDYHPEEVIAPFLKSAGTSVARVRLQPLSSDRVYQLTNERWAKWKATNPLPYDKVGLNGYFQRMPRTVGRALELLKKSIEIKLLVYGEGPAWPGDPNLAFPPEQIENIFKYLDTNP
jgi:hypothetical protein